MKPRYFPPKSTRVYKLPKGTNCTASVVGEMEKLPRKMKKAVEQYWKQRLEDAHKKGIHNLFNGVVYGVNVQFFQKRGQLHFSLFETSYARLLARWLKMSRNHFKLVPGFSYVTCPGLLITKATKTEESHFVFGLINPNRTFGLFTNFIGGTLDQHHAARSNPLEANLWDECEEEVGIDLTHVEKWRFKYLAKTEQAFHLVAELRLKLTVTQMEEHFKRFTLRDKEKEIIELIKVPATKKGVIEFLSKNPRLVRPMAEVLQVAVGLKQPDEWTDAA